MTTALIITTYNRPSYLFECIGSLIDLSEQPDGVIIVDDGSDTETLTYIRQYIEHYRNDTYLIRKSNAGIKDSLKIGFSQALVVGKFDLAINLDSDAIVKPNFIARLKELKERYPDHIVSGFNCNNPKNPILYDGEDYVLRNHCNGINMCIDKKQYENIVLPALQSQGNWDYNSTHNLPIVISKPSVVQHIAPNDSTMGHVKGDVACDY